MEQALEAQAITAPRSVHTLTKVDVVSAPAIKKTQKVRLRWRFAAAFILLLVFAPTLAMLVWTVLKNRY